MIYEEDTAVRRVTGLLVQIAVVIALAWFCVYSFGTRAAVPGQSMSPTLEDGDRVLLDRFTLKLAGPRRFDIVLFSAGEGSAPNVKRIIGLPGETVEITGGQIFIDGEPLREDGSGYGGTVSIGGLAERPLLLGEGEYFVLGDNRDMSEDSRFDTVGNIPLRRIVGKVWFRTAPFERIGIVK